MEEEREGQEGGGGDGGRRPVFIKNYTTNMPGPRSLSAVLPRISRAGSYNLRNYPGYIFIHVSGGSTAPVKYN